MSTVTVSRTVPQPLSEVWQLLADFGSVHRFSPGVETSPINAGKPETGVGAERNCHLYDGNHIQERVTEFLPGERLSLEVFDTSMPIKTAGASFELAETMTASLNRLLAGLEHHLGTGESISQGWRPGTEASAVAP